MLTNPFTNEPFASSVVDAVKRRVFRLDRLGYNIALEIKNNQTESQTQHTAGEQKSVFLT